MDGEQHEAKEASEVHWKTLCPWVVCPKCWFEKNGVKPLNWLKFIHSFFGYPKITTIFFGVLDLTLILITKMPNIQSSGNISVETILSRLSFFLFDVLAFLAHESPHEI